jgi:hypothetical protein
MAKSWAAPAKLPFVKHTLSPSGDVELTVEGGEVSENVEPANGGANGSSTATAVGLVAPSCYRVSLLSGLLEVSARLTSADDLELLLKVLEANKVLFAKADRSTIKDLAKAMAKADRSGTNVLTLT